MGEKVIDGNISFVALTDEEQKVYGYEIFLAYDNGSGITVTGDTKEQAAEKIKDYLIDGLADAENL